MEWGSSSRTPSNAASRMSSATSVSSGSSVISPSGYSGGPSGKRPMRASLKTSSWNCCGTDTGTMSAQVILDVASSAAMLDRCSAIRFGEARSDFVAMATRLGFRDRIESSPIRYRSPGPIRSLAGRQTPTTSTSDQVLRTTSLSRSPSRVRGLCRPGVSITTSWASGRCTMPRTAWRVVCGFDEAMTIFWPTNALVSVDLPAFGRPTRQAKPDRSGEVSVTSYLPVDVSTAVLRNDPPIGQSRGRFDGCTKRTQQRLSQLAHIQDLASGVNGPDRDAGSWQVVQQIKIVFRCRGACYRHGFQAVGARRNRHCHGNREGRQLEMLQVHARG